MASDKDHKRETQDRSDVDMARWFEELDKFNSERFMPDGRRQPATPESAAIDAERNDKGRSGTSLSNSIKMDGDLPPRLNTSVFDASYGFRSPTSGN